MGEAPAAVGVGVVLVRRHSDGSPWASPGIKAIATVPPSTRSRSWHCYSATGAPADAKAITRLVPRRDNRRDRDVAEAQASPARAKT
jgi:hypothetical protein